MNTYLNQARLAGFSMSNHSSKPYITGTQS